MSAAGAWRGQFLAALMMIGLAACGGGHGSSSTPAGPVLEPIGNQQVAPTQSLVLRLTAANPDDARLTYSSSALPANADLVPSTGLFVFTPDASQAGATYTVTFTVNDGAHEDSESVQISVTATVPPANGSPVLDPIGDHDVHVGETLTLQQHATDPDGDAITFSVHPPLPENATYDNQAGLFTFTPSADQAATTHSASSPTTDTASTTRPCTSRCARRRRARRARRTRRPARRRRPARPRAR